MFRPRSRGSQASSQSGQRPELLVTRPRRGPLPGASTYAHYADADESAAGNAEPADLCIRPRRIGLRLEAHTRRSGASMTFGGPPLLSRPVIGPFGCFPVADRVADGQFLSAPVRGAGGAG